MNEVIELKSSEVRTLNWLQAYSAQRFLFARDNDFNILVEDKQYEDEGERIVAAMKKHFIDWNVIMRLALDNQQNTSPCPNGFFGDVGFKAVRPSDD